MTFKKLRKHIDFAANIRIWLDDDLVFEGMAFDCPKKYNKYKLIKKEDNEDCEALCPYLIYNTNGSPTRNYGLRITLTKGGK